MTILTDTPTAPGPTATNSVRLPPRRTRLRGIPLSYLWCELRRPMRRSNLIFNLALPAVLYLALFRAGPSDANLPGGNFALWMMIGIAVYGSAAASTSAAASIAMEKASGWMRTTIVLAPTPAVAASSKGRKGGCLNTTATSVTRLARRLPARR